MSLPQRPIGNTNFEELRTEGLFFVDKTKFIAQIIEKKSKVMLFLRPRRFGKTLNMWMLRSFFERTDKCPAHLFRGLEIEASPHFKQIGTRPVIFLSFKDLKCEQWATFRELIAELLEDETLRQHKLACQLCPQQAPQLLELIAQSRKRDSGLMFYLKRLSHLLYDIYDKKVLILIDEYDTPFQFAEKKGYSGPVTDFFRVFLPSALKDNHALEKGILTGILRVAKESIFSGLNHLDVFDQLRDEFGAFFGFTESEVQSTLALYGLQAHEKAVRDWYNGYIFGKTSIYNPWSILKFIDEERLGAYWLETAAPDEVGRVLESGLAKRSNYLQNILLLTQGQSVPGRLREDLTYLNYLDSMDGILSLLTYAGYLSCEPLPDIYKKECLFRMANQEVSLLFHDLAMKWISGTDTAKNAKSVLVEILRSGECDRFSSWLQQAILDGVSFHDLQSQKENFYHALLLGMAILLYPDYRAISNHEAGYGRFDLQLTPKEKDWPAYILEIKNLKDANSDSVEVSLNVALAQIEEKRYAEALRRAAYPQILSIALVFSGKRVWLKAKSETQSRLAQSADMDAEGQ